MQKLFKFIETLSVICFSAFALPLSAATFTEDTVIKFNDTNYDGLDIVVTNCTVTIDGIHRFQSVTVQNGGALTHTYAANGHVTELLAIVDEPHTLAPTNTFLDRTNVMAGTVIVKDATGATQYVQGNDFQVNESAGRMEVTLVTGSAIAPGAQLLISYTVNLGGTSSGLFVSTIGSFTIEAGARIDATGRGFGPGGGPGQGSSRSTNSPAVYVAGAGGGHGGYGGLSSSLAVGGNSYGFPMEASTRGSAGGGGSSNGGTGGGLISLNVSGELRVDGTILCSGADATNSRAGGGSGGGIRLLAQTVAGIGVIAADGGAGEPRQGGGGGGGRIFLACQTNEFLGTFSAKGGQGWMPGGAGTIATATTGFAGGRLQVNNGGIAGTNTPLHIGVGQEVLVTGKAKVQLSNNSTLLSLSVGPDSTLILPDSLLIVTGDARIDAGGRVDAKGKGYPANSGPGRGTYGSYPSGGAGGGGYGGNGGGPQDGSARFLGGTSYGSALQPIERGSGGGFAPGPLIGGAGGGAIRLDIRGELTLNGSVAADGDAGAEVPSGQNAVTGGGGSGGSVWLTAGKLSGSGIISANGGDGALPSGGGAGGRIAIYATTNAFTGGLQAHGGSGSTAGGAGTIYVQGAVDRPPRLIVDNGGNLGTNTPLLGFPLTGMALEITGGAKAPYPQSSLNLYSLLVGSNSWFQPGYSASLFYIEVLHSVILEGGGGISLDGMGYTRGSGPGAGRYLNYYGCGGGGYGGYGGNGLTNVGGGNAYGFVVNPRDPGSGGGYALGETGQNANAGGGAMILNVREDLVLDGTLSANGISAMTNRNGGGSGGTINVNVQTIYGNGLMRANGGAGLGGGGGGGGGRIFVQYRTSQFAGAFQAEGGPGGPIAGGPGTICLQQYQGTAGTQVIIDNGGKTGTNALVTGVGNLGDLTLRNGGAASFTRGLTFPVRNLRIGPGCALYIESLSTAGSILRISGDATIERGGRIAALSTSFSSGPGSGRYSPPYGGGGGSHGGYGTDPAGVSNLLGSLYGSITSPNMPGSAGGRPSTDVPGGGGGGALQMAIERTLILDGRIDADGMPALGVNCGGGSGGSVFVDARTIRGSGTISANGGDGEFPNGGGGGGGRVALLYRTNEFTGSFSARGGRGPVYGGAGTVYLKSTYEPFGRVFVDNGEQAGGLTGLMSGSPSFHLSVSRGGIVFPHGTAALPALQSLRVGPGGGLIHSAAQRYLDLTVLGDMTIEAQGSVSADAKGYALNNPGPGFGHPGGLSGSGGGGYGGVGGAGAGGAAGGITYGNPEAPFEPGSSGGTSPAVPGSSEGGGIIRLKVGGTLTIDGRVSANGNDGWWGDSGGGSGGSVWLSAREIRGAGAITANGGMGEPFNGGGGGGGRIALYYVTNRFAETAGYIMANGGEGANPGENGSIYFSTNLPVPTVISQSTPLPTQPATYVDLLYSAAMDSSSLAETEVSLKTPNETLTPTLYIVGADSRTVRVGFPAQNTPGDYQFIIGPQIKDWMGVPASVPYTGSFTLQAPLIGGRITDPSGAPVPGVTIQPSGSLSGVTSDAEGLFSLAVLPGWSGAIVPFLSGKAFLPRQLEFVNVITNQPDQRFLATEPELLRVRSAIVGTNLNVSWFALTNVTYHVLYSTNLVEWYATGEPLAGDANEHVLPFPLDQYSSAFITVKPVF